MNVLASYLFQEIVTGGDLFSYLESKGGMLSETDATVIVYQILMGVKYLDEEHVVHGDLKPENILLASKSSGCRVILTDFGAARRIEQHKARVVNHGGTTEYAAP